MKITVAPLSILTLLTLTLASCGEPIHTADMPKPDTAPSSVGKIPQPTKADPSSAENKDEESDALPRNVFAENTKDESSEDTFMEIQTGFQEFDLGDDPLSDRYNFSNFPKVGE